MSKGNDTQILAVLFELKKASTLINNFKQEGCSEEEVINIKFLLEKLNHIIKKHEFDDDNIDAFAPVQDIEVKEINREAISFTGVLRHTLFNNENNKHYQQKALGALSQFDSSEDEVTVAQP